MKRSFMNWLTSTMSSRALVHLEFCDEGSWKQRFWQWVLTRSEGLWETYLRLRYSRAYR